MRQKQEKNGWQNKINKNCIFGMQLLTNKNKSDCQ